MRVLVANKGIIYGTLSSQNIGVHYLASATIRPRIASNLIHSSYQTDWRLFSEPQDNERNDSRSDDGIDPITILPTVTLVCISALAAGVLYTKANNPNTYFDIDFYMALDGVLGNISAGADSSPESIFGLPQLSPAEQLVGAIFGPPLSPR